MIRIRKYPSALMVLLMLVMLLTPASLLQANFRFFSIVQQVCKSYRVMTTVDQMSLENADTETSSFYLNLQSRRNNFEEVMLVGYLAAGEAAARTGIGVNTINITITIPNMDNMLLMTTAPASLVNELRNGNIKSSAFMRQLTWN